MTYLKSAPAQTAEPVDRPRKTIYRDWLYHVALTPKGIAHVEDQDRGLLDCLPNVPLADGGAIVRFRAYSTIPTQAGLHRGKSHVIAPYLDARTSGYILNAAQL